MSPVHVVFFSQTSLPILVDSFHIFILSFIAFLKEYLIYSVYHKNNTDLIKKAAIWGTNGV